MNFKLSFSKYLHIVSLNCIPQKEIYSNLINKVCCFLFCKSIYYGFLGEKLVTSMQHEFKDIYRYDKKKMCFLNNAIIIYKVDAIRWGPHCTCSVF